MAEGINFRFPFRKSAKGAFEINQSTVEAVSDDLRILILTNHGERPIHYDFGANLRKIIFEQGFDIKQKVSDSINAAVEKWMPFVTLTEIEIEDITTNSTLKQNELYVKIKFMVGQIEGALKQKVRA